VQGTLRDKRVRKSLDLTNWEAAQRLVREWESEGTHEIPTVEEAFERIAADMRALGRAEDSIAKLTRLKNECVGFFGNRMVSVITPDEVARFREGWKGRPSTIQKKVERVRSFF
jgi:hypothetical protein